MNKVLLSFFCLLLSANAGLNERVDASLVSKYEVCSLKLSKIDGYKYKSKALKKEANRVHFKNIGSIKYTKYLKEEKEKAWLIPIHKCRKIANALVPKV